MTPPEERTGNQTANDSTGSRAKALGESARWRVGHQGRDQMYYEEWGEGAWRRIIISGELLTGRAHHVIYFASPDEWLRYPDWARQRRDEIIARVKSEFRPPDYEYDGGSPARSPGADSPLQPSAGKAAPLPQSATVSGRPQIGGNMAKAGRGQLTPAVVLVIVLLLSLTVGLAWVAASGLSRGQTFFPSKRGSHQRTVSRQLEPVTFWICIGIYSALGLGSLGFAGWLFREAVKHQNPGGRGQAPAQHGSGANGPRKAYLR